MPTLFTGKNGGRRRKSKGERKAMRGKAAVDLAATALKPRLSDSRIALGHPE
jgi:hypothetical protein